ncbi:MAG TPA: FtsX-like permease family protein [Verrucomicrobiae bacterium]|nr:FtsX-like permease family protein [Verrucomicrobiae bacterium]
MRFFPLIWSNLRRRKLRSALTLLSIIVAFVLFGLLCAIKQALAGGVSYAKADRLITRDKVSIIQLLPRSYEDRMKRIPGVAAVCHQTWFGGHYQDPKNFFMQSPVDPEEFLDLNPSVKLPEDQKKAWLATRTGAIVGRGLAEKYHWHIGSKVPIESPIWPKTDGNHVWDFDIVGIYDTDVKGGDTALLFRYDYFDEARQYLKGKVGWYTIRVKDASQAAEVARRVDQEFENSPSETKTEPEGAFAQGWASQVGNIALITASIMGAVFFTILLVTGNTMSQAVRERAGELGVLKALGFTNIQVVSFVLVESCLLAAMGAICGLGLAWLFTSRGDPTGGMLPMFYLPWKDLLTGLGIAAVLGVITGFFPALNAMRLRVADALRRM